MCAFVLAAIARDYPHGQNACWREKVFHSCFERLDEGDFLLRQWSALCIGQMWDRNDDIKIFGVDNGTQDKFISLLTDDSPEVRAAVLFALGTFMGASGSGNSSKTGGGGTGIMHHLEERVHFRMEVAVVTGGALAIKEDASPMVRKELLVLISCLVKEWRGHFVVCAWVYWEEDRRWRLGAITELRDEDVTSQAISEWLDSFGDEEVREENRVILSSFFTIFSVLLELSVDPYHEVATNAQTIVDYIMALLLESPFTRLESSTLHQQPPSQRVPTGGARSRRSSVTSSPTSTTRPSSPNVSRSGVTRSDTMSSTISSGMSNTLKRTSSFANALKNLAGGIAFPSIEDGRSSPHRISHPHTSLITSFEKQGVSRPPSPNLNFAQYAAPYSRPSSPQALTSSKSTPSSPTASAPNSTEDRSHVSTDFLPSDVMEALMEEDMERLRARRRATHGTRGRNAVPHSPADSTFSSDSAGSSVILGLGTGAGIRDILPLKSRFFDWCCEYFKEPQMRVNGRLNIPVPVLSIQSFLASRS